MISSNQREYRNRKSPRPFSKDQALHVTMRSDIAKNEWSLLSMHVHQWLKNYIPTLSKRCGVRLYHYSIQSNHLHLVVKTKEKKSLNCFLRVLAGMIPRKVLGAEKCKAKRIRFWKERPYSRLIAWGREFKNVMSYVERNCMEIKKLISYTKRHLKLSNNDKQRIHLSLYENHFKRRSLLEGQALLF